MHSNLDSLLMLAYIRHRELQDEAARIRLVQEADGSGFMDLIIVKAVRSRLKMALDRAGELLRDSRHANVRVRRSTKAA